MTFFNFFMSQTGKRWPISETVLESFPDSDNFDYFL